MSFRSSKPHHIKENFNRLRAASGKHVISEDISSIVEASNVNSVMSAIKKVKNSLINKWKRYGGYENFGDKEYRVLCDKFKRNPYGDSDERTIAKLLDNFADWAANYDGSEINELGNGDGDGDPVFDRTAKDSASDWPSEDGEQDITLQQDNGGRNLPPNQGKKITVNMKFVDIIKYAKMFFKWRGDVDLNKITSLGSSDYDRFIEFLHNKSKNIK